MRALLPIAALALLASSGAYAQTAGDASQVGAALNTQTYATNSNNLSNSNNGSGNTTVNGGSASSGGTILNQASSPTTTTSIVRTVPNIVTPNLTSSGLDTCLGSSSGGLSVLGLGATAASTKPDENCVMLKQVKLLGELGLKDAAVARMLQDENMRAALLVAYPAFLRLAPEGTKLPEGAVVAGIAPPKAEEKPAEKRAP